MVSTKNAPIDTSSIATLTGVIESDIQFVEGSHRPRCRFTLRTRQDDLFFMQAFGERREICRTVKQGDVIMAITLPRSSVHRGCGKPHIYFELVNFWPVLQL